MHGGWSLDKNMDECMDGWIDIKCKIHALTQEAMAHGLLLSQLLVGI